MNDQFVPVSSNQVIGVIDIEQLQKHRNFFFPLSFFFPFTFMSSFAHHTSTKAKSVSLVEHVSGCIYLLIGVLL